MSRCIEIKKGTRFGRLTVLSSKRQRLQRRSYYFCLCDCGKKIIVRLTNLRSGHTQSCGCLHRDLSTSHGLSDTPEFRSWRNIKQRCLNPKCEAYEYYGGRGIKVCKRWRDSFIEFFKDMGPRPSPKHSIDRINNDGNYTPKNCRWATPKQQNNNRRTVYKRSGSKDVV